MAKGRFKAATVTPKFRRDGREIEMTFKGVRGDEAKVAIDAEALGLLIAALIPMIETAKVSMATYVPPDGDPDEFVDGPRVFHAVEIRGANWFETGALGLRLWTVEKKVVEIHLQHELAKALIGRLEIAANPIPGHGRH